MLWANIIDPRHGPCGAWLGEVMSEVTRAVLWKRSRRRLRLVHGCRNSIVLRTVVDLTDQFAHALSFISFPARFPFFAVQTDFLGQLGIDNLVHFPEVSSPPSSQTKLEEVDSLKL